MFKQVKSAVFWYYLYKFRRRVIFICFLLLVAIFANSIYTDVVQYLQLKNKLEYLEYVLIIKWVIIISSVLVSIYLILTIFKNKNCEEDSNKKDKVNKQKINNQKVTKEKITNKLSKREEEFLNKGNLKSKADRLLDR
ncbi:hypothetical protein [Arcobacter sp. CECT 8985]|uniref:hypothetical protein n=1 Tax=Arcobacter sp. CECT 8985 TaxID=1935424 RepID=UPI00100A62C5|nr:hypothetical protein [Arcobacter sp. CECT 8985]RXJ87223.1 hypothetical protein CRU93_04755 [Arcobacter sp. CECT 8985]